MKKPFIMLMMSSCLLSTPSIAQVVVNDPVATSQAVITCGNARFTVLTPEMIRVEGEAGSVRGSVPLRYLSFRLDVVIYK